jgi:hypothetical protein
MHYLQMFYVLVVYWAAHFVASASIGVASNPNDITTLGTQSLPSPSSKPGTTGSFITKLDTSGHSSVQPFPTTSIDTPGFSASLNLKAKIAQVKVKTRYITMSNIFSSPIATGAPASVIKSRSDHPVPRKGVVRSRHAPRTRGHR